MKTFKIFLLSFVILFANKANCQENSGTKDMGIVAPPAHPDPDAEKIFTKVDAEAQFPGGPNAWSKYVSQNINEKILEAAPAGTYTVIVKFIVHKNGDISDVQATTHVGYGLEKEAVRLVKNSPKWIPAEYGSVSSYRLLPMTFIVPK